jgi:protein phosphatase 1L
LSLYCLTFFSASAGNLASKYAASKLYDKILQNLPNLFAGFAQDDPESWKEEVRQNVTLAFEEVHDGFLEAVEIVASPVIEAGSAPSMDQSGTTATALVVTKDVILVVSLGDSRAVMSSRDGKNDNGWTDFPSMAAIQLTPDHVASDPSERDLVIARGGSISSNKGGLERVNGTLAITRSIGDANLSSVLSREPHVLVLDRKEIEKWCGELNKTKEIPCFVILASDGLWDVMSNQEAVDMVVDTILRGSNALEISGGGSLFQDAAERLAVEAYVRGSTDNIGVCVVAVD